MASRSPDDCPPERYYQNIRDHWGIESRLHWRKDAILYEDKTRCRNPIVVANLMLLRNLVIHFYEHSHQEGERMPAWVNQNTAITEPYVAVSVVFSGPNKKAVYAQGFN